MGGSFIRVFAIVRMTGQTRETSRRMLARFLFFHFFCFCFFRSRKVNARLDSIQLHDFRPKVFGLNGR